MNVLQKKMTVLSGRHAPTPGPPTHVFALMDLQTTIQKDLGELVKVESHITAVRFTNTTG